MIPRHLAIACVVGGCGAVTGPVGGDAGGSTPDGARTPDAAMARTYQGSIGQTPAVPFGGAPYCNYTITLKQLELDLDIMPAGPVVSGRVQDLNVEGTDASCPNGVIPASLAHYTLQSAVASGTTTQLIFLGAPDNVPAVSLTADLSPTTSAYSAVLHFHRTDQDPPLDWAVTVTLPLAPQ